MITDKQFYIVRTQISKLIEQHRPRESKIWKSIEQIAEEPHEKIYVDFKAKDLKSAKDDAEEVFGEIISFCKIDKLRKVNPGLTDQQAKAKLLRYHFPEVQEGVALGYFAAIDSSFIKVVREHCKKLFT